MFLKDRHNEMFDDYRTIIRFIVDSIRVLHNKFLQAVHSVMATEANELPETKVSGKLMSKIVACVCVCVCVVERMVVTLVDLYVSPFAGVEAGIEALSSAASFDSILLQLRNVEKMKETALWPLCSCQVGNDGFNIK